MGQIGPTSKIDEISSKLAKLKSNLMKFDEISSKLAKLKSNLMNFDEISSKLPNPNSNLIKFDEMSPPDIILIYFKISWSLNISLYIKVSYAQIPTSPRARK